MQVMLVSLLVNKLRNIKLLAIQRIRYSISYLTWVSQIGNNRMQAAQGPNSKVQGQAYTKLGCAQNREPLESGKGGCFD